MRLGTDFTLQNIPSKYQDVHASFCYETNTAFTLQIMPSENQDLYIAFCYKTGHWIYFAEFIPLILNMYMHPFVLKTNTILLCRLCCLKIKIYI